MIAGLAKCADIVAFYGVLSRWSVIPHSLVAPLTAIIPALEFGLGLAWLLNIRRRIVGIAVALLLLVFACVATWQFLVYSPVDCGCFGIRIARSAQISDLWWLLCRNLTSATVMLGWVLLPATTPRSHDNHAPGGDRTSDATNGFTLLESIVVVTIIGILIAVLIPALHMTKLHADRISDLADLRTHTSIIALYNNDHSGLFPNYIDPIVGRGQLPDTDLGEIAYFDQSQFWPIALLSTYYKAGTLGEEFYLRGAEADLEDNTVGFLPSYIFGSAFLSHPGYWNPNSRQSPPAQLGPVRNDQVLFPSQKSMFDAPTRNGLTAPGAITEPGSARLVLASFVDGAAEALTMNRVNPGYPNGPGEYPPWAHGRYPWTVLAYTIDGVRGLDVGP